MTEGQPEPVEEPCKPGQQCEIVRLGLPARFGCPLCPWKPIGRSIADWREERTPDRPE